MSLNIDMQPLWDSINANFPIFFGILATIGGIGIALKLGEFLINKVQSMFGGR